MNFFKLMLLSFLVTLVYINSENLRYSPDFSMESTVALYGQCGGISYSGSTVCTAPYCCVAANAYYSQCTACPTSQTYPTLTPTKNLNTNAVAKYGQCGGLGYTGSNTCTPPYCCVAENTYYSQCTTCPLGLAYPTFTPTKSPNTNSGQRFSVSP